MIIALIISIALNVILLISSQDCNNCALLHILKEKDKKMISLIIVFYNYFVWLFTGSVPMDHINKDIATLTLFFFTFVELLIEIGLIRFIIDLLVSIRFRKKDN